MAASSSQHLSSLVVNKQEETLRDLISRSSCALDEVKRKLGPSRQHLEPELSIRLVVDKATKALTIVDSGIGMTRSDLFRHVDATACSSGGTTNDYPASATMPGLSGLRSAYLASKKVMVTTKHEDDDQQYLYVWVPQAGISSGSSFTVGVDDTDGERLRRGTKVTLFLNDDQLEYLKERRLKDLVNKYSGSIGYPIYLQLWTEKATGDEEEITREEYASSYKSLLTDDWGDHLAVSVKHFSVAEGPVVKFSAVLFVSRRRLISDTTHNIIYARDPHAHHVLKCERLLPEWLAAVVTTRAVHDDATLDDVKGIRKHMVKESIEMLLQLAENNEHEYSKLYGESFSSNLKLGIVDGGEDSKENLQRLAGLLRYHSTTTGAGGMVTGLKGYVARMEEGHKVIYYTLVTAAAESSSFEAAAVERLKQQGHEVLFMADAIDDRVVLVLKEYDGKVLVSATMWAATPGCFLQLFKHVTADATTASNPAMSCQRAEPEHVASSVIPRGSGHVARGCPLLYHEHDVPGAPHRRPVWVGASPPSPDTAKTTPEQRTVAGESLLLYKARVCVEGVPAHARRIETVAGLFAAAAAGGGGGFALVEGLDHGRLAEKEVECVCAWVWTRDPDAIAKAGTLLIQEPRGSSAWPSLVHSDRRLIGCSPAAAGPPRMLAYDVIIHLDRVYDYSPASSSADGGDHGGHWPRCHVFSWHLGALDGVTPAPC
ncbi:hypothetical protein HU200_065746 [Digitaria exilis]|uniref:Uncharacterized protein n=1 Tax=Digitaria exilis TaxID=1010633 RepID=A0A835A384_9POAL|nr:hypothetical protein HU200_065746 [Digitaria exilis]